MRIVGIFAVLSVALACGKDEETDDTGAPDESDASGDSDDTSDETATDSSEVEDSSEPEDTTPLEPCLFHHGIHSAGSRWDYRWTQSIRTGFRYMTVENYNGAANTATLVTTESWGQTTGGVQVNTVTREEVMCDASGLYALTRSRDNSENIAGNLNESVTVSTFNPPALVRPNQPVGGVFWTSREAGTRTVDGGAPTSFDSSTMWGVTREDQRYNETWPSTTRIESPPPSSTQYHWVHEVGRIESTGEWVLVTHTP